MKRLILMTILVGLMATPALAVPSLEFKGSGPSWTLGWTGANWTLSFTPGSTAVDDSNPSGDAVMSDFVNLPSMTLGGITVVIPGVILSAHLTPTELLTITPDGGGSAVMTASVVTGGKVTVTGSTIQSYTTGQDDLDMVSHTAAYSSTVIDEFATSDASGWDWDLSFTLTKSPGSINLVGLIMGGGSDSAEGTIRGQMSIIPIPAPGAILLGSIGVCLVGWLRRRRTL